MLQFHFHATLEHAVNGSTDAMKSHFVHRHADGGLAVRDVFRQSGAFNDERDRIFTHVGSLHGKDDEVPYVMDVNVQDLLPGSTEGWFHEGSLTTPLASQPVNRFPFSDPFEMSQAQTDAYLAVADDSDPAHDFDHGNRALQPLNGR